MDQTQVINLQGLALFYFICSITFHDFVSDICSWLYMQICVIACLTSGQYVNHNHDEMFTRNKSGRKCGAQHGDPFTKELSATVSERLCTTFIPNCTRGENTM